MGLPITTVIGNIQKIETRQTQTGKSVTSINISCGEKNAKGEYDNLYIKASFWEKQSDFVSQYFKEGDAIIVTGKLVTTHYQKQDGTKVYETGFMFPSASFVPKSKDQTQPAPQQAPSGYQAPAQNAPSPQVPEMDMGEIPFSPLGMSEGGYYVHLI